MVKNIINVVNLVKIGHFWRKWSDLGQFGDQNDVIGPHFRVVRKKYFLRTVSKDFLVGFI